MTEQNISWNGHAFRGVIIGKHPSGDHLVRATSNGPRFVKGTIVRVKPEEIVPPTPSQEQQT